MIGSETVNPEGIVTRADPKLAVPVFVIVNVYV